MRSNTYIITSHRINFLQCTYIFIGIDTSEILFLKLFFLADWCNDVHYKYKGIFFFYFISCETHSTMRDFHVKIVSQQHILFWHQDLQFIYKTCHMCLVSYLIFIKLRAILCFSVKINANIIYTMFLPTIWHD